MYLIWMCSQLAGLLLFGCGIWFVSAPSSLALLNAIDDNSSFQHLVRASGGILIGVGLVLMIVGCAGCWGSLTNKTGCLTCFQALLVFIFVQTIVTVLAGVFHVQLNNELTRSIYQAVNDSEGYVNNRRLHGDGDIDGR